MELALKSSSVLIYQNTPQRIYIQMKWHHATLINNELKAKLKSLSLCEIMKYDYEFFDQKFGSVINFGH